MVHLVTGEPKKRNAKKLRLQNRILCKQETDNLSISVSHFE